MLNKTDNIFYNTNVNVFASQICEALKSACESFWEQDVKIKLQGINDFRELRKEKLVSNLDFFTSQIKVDNHKPIIIRLSQEFIGEILELALQSNTSNFNFKHLTSLEIKILNGFCEFAYKKIKDILLNVPISEKSEKYTNLIFLILNKNNICSKIMVSIPQDRISHAPLKKVVAFKDEDFLSSNTTIRLKAGSSKITFDELQNLAPEDIIVLEESNLNKMKLISGDSETEFNIKINPSLILDLGQDEQDEEEQEEEFTNNEVTMGKNLWDDIQIEINAEFEKVKMTIGELKHITEGQIVDLGSIFENEISLFVEERKVATGELIIINDRYAVRLNKILNANTQTPIKANVEVEPQPKPQAKQVAQPQQAKPQAQPQPKPQAKPQPQPKPQAQAQPPVEDEEFDYSDFEK